MLITDEPCVKKKLKKKMPSDRNLGALSFCYAFSLAASQAGH
jgi:hypothetical protein